MLVLFPVFLLIVFALIIQFLGRFRLSRGSTWLISVVASMVVWILIIIIHLRLPAPVLVDFSLAGIPETDRLAFQFSPETWVLGFLLVSLLVVVTITASIDITKGSYLTVLSGSMALTAAGLLSILSKSTLAFIITWSLIDLMELSILVLVVKEPEIHRNSIYTFSTRLLGIILLVIILALHNSTNAVFSRIQGDLLVVVAILRMGVIPARQSYTRDLSIRRGIGTILRMIAPISAFAFLLMLPVQELTWRSGFLWLGMLAILYGAVSWYGSKGALEGRPYWVLSFTGIAIIAFVNGKPNAILATAAVMGFAGAWMFMNTQYVPRMIFLLGFLFLATAGLPFSPSAEIWSGILGESFNVTVPLILISLAFLFAGMFTHFQKVKPVSEVYEKWMELFFIIGMFFCALAPWFPVLWQVKKLHIQNIWWFSLIVIFLSGLIILLEYLIRKRIILRTERDGKIRDGISHGFEGIRRLFRLKWLGSGLKLIYIFMANVNRSFLLLLEGDGGFLWSLLLLVLLVSLLQLGRTP